MKRYFSIFIKIIANNLIRDMEFKGNFILMVFMQFLWTILQLALLEILFLYTDNLVGWTKLEMFAFIGLYRITKGIFDTLFYANLMYLPENVNRGELDYHLVKPINSLFLTSIRRHYFDNLGHIIAGTAVLGYALSASPGSITVGFTALLLLSVVTGVIAFYSLMLSLATLSFFTQRLTALSSFYDVLNNALRYPLDLYSRKRTSIQLLFVPLAAVVFIPASVLFHKISLTYMIAEIVISALMLWGAYKFWNLALRHYSSASS